MTERGEIVFNDDRTPQFPQLLDFFTVYEVFEGQDNRSGFRAGSGKAPYFRQEVFGQIQGSSHLLFSI
jgi:hypothetical protein